MENYPLEHVKKRLVTGLGNKGGARGSLTRCVGRLGGLKRALTNESGEQSVSEASDLFEQELQLARIEMLKLLFLFDRQKKDLELWTTIADDGASTRKGQSVTPNTIEKEVKVVQKLRQDLQQATSMVVAKAEYEQTAKLLVAKHPTPTYSLESTIKTLEAELAGAQRDYDLAKQKMDIRKRQFQTLLQNMLDLKQSLAMDRETGLFVIPTSQDRNTGNADESNKKPKYHQTDTLDKRNIMTTKSNFGTMRTSPEDDEDEEGALYDDL